MFGSFTVLTFAVHDKSVKEDTQLTSRLYTINLLLDYCKNMTKNIIPILQRKVNAKQNGFNLMEITNVKIYAAK